MTLLDILDYFRPRRGYDAHKRVSDAVQHNKEVVHQARHEIKQARISLARAIIRADVVRLDEHLDKR